MHQQKNKGGFTLAELIVVVTIVAILGTISFLMFSNYGSSARDTARKSDLNTIVKFLQINKLNAGDYPVTSDAIDIAYSGATLWSQGVFGEETQIDLGKHVGELKDPLYGNQYTYSVTNNQQEYQIGALFEKNNPDGVEDIISMNFKTPSLFDTTYASTDFTPLELSPSIWLDATDIDGDGAINDNPSNNGDVTSWKNKSTAGATNDPSITNGVLKYSTNGFDSSYPGVFIANNRGLLLNNSDITTGDIFYVVQNIDPFGGTDANGHGLQSSVSSNFSFGFWGARRHAVRMQNAPKQHNSGSATSSGRNWPFVYSFHTDNINYEFYDTGRIISQGSTTSITGEVWAINRAGAMNSRADWIISEILVFDTKLSDSNREKIEGYLAHKWGQDNYLPSGHPYLSTPPEGSTPPTPDTVPDNFTLSNVSDATPSTQYISNSITVNGINTSTSIGVSGGTGSPEYSINNGAYTSISGNVTVGDSVRVRLNSSASGSTPTTATLNIGGVTEQYTVTTRVIDTTPDNFSFSSIDDASISTQYNSNAITVSGINSITNVSISGGSEYKIGDSIPYDVTGGGSASASSTYSPDYIPSQGFDNNSTQGWASDGSMPAWLEYDLGSGGSKIVNKYTLYRSSNEAGSDAFSPRNWTLEGSNNGSSWTILDTRSNQSISNDVTKREFEISTPGSYRYYRINVSSAQGSNITNITEIELIDEGGVGTFTSTPGNVDNGDIITVRTTSSPNTGTARTATLTVGTESSDFVVTTLAPDTTPDNFSFSDETDVTLSSTQTSNPVTLTGINSSSPISIAGGSGLYSINSGGFTSTSGSINNGDTVRVRLIAPSSNSSSKSTTLSIGGVEATYNVSTVAPPPDTTPDAFTFTDRNDAQVSTQYISDLVTISGINSSTPISIAGGEYSKNGSSTFTSNTGNVDNGDTITVRMTSSPSVGTTLNSVLTVGGVQDTYSITTIPADTTPDTFSLSPISDAQININYSSNPIIVSDINSSTPIAITAGDGQIIINDTDPVTNGSVSNGDTVIVEMISSPSWSTPKSTTLNIGGVTGDFTVTTGVGDTTPDQFSFNDLLEVNLNTEYLSDSITITGINSPTPISIVGGEYRIGSDTLFTTANGQITNNQEVTIRATSSNTSSTTSGVNVTIGGIQDSFDLTTYDFVTSTANDVNIPSSNMYVKGDYNGLFVHGTSTDGLTHYVVAAPSIITNDPTDTDIESIIEGKKFVYNNFENIPASYAGNELTMTGGFDFTINEPLLYEGSKEDLGSYGGLQQIDALVRSNYTYFPAYYNVADKLDTFGLGYVEKILANSVGINPIKPYYCNDIKNSKLLFNIASKATITASPSAWNTYGTGGIANGIKSPEGDLDYEYHSADGNAKITFDWPSVQKIGYVKIYNRTRCCSDRMSGALVKLYDAGDNLIYTHPLWDTTDDYVIDLDLEGIDQLHYVKRMTLETVGGNYMNIREVEIYTGGDVIDGVYKVDRDGAGGQSPYNVYCDMTTDGGGWTRIGENYVTNGQFVGGQQIEEHTGGYSGFQNRIVSQTPPSYIPEAGVFNVAGGSTQSYDLYFEDVPGSFFAQEIRLYIWQKNTESSLFSYNIDYRDGTTASAIGEVEQLEQEGDWTQYIARIPLESEVENFTWRIGEGAISEFQFTDPKMEIYYR